MGPLSRSAVTKVTSDRFQVDFARLRRHGLISGLVKPEPVEIDPYRVGQAIRATMSRGDSRTVSGAPLVWNEYKLFLSPDDYDRLRPMKRGLETDLGAVIEGALDALGAETVGDPVIRILVDDETELPAGVGEIVASFADNADLAPDVDGQMTVRLSRRQGPARTAIPPEGGQRSTVLEPGRGTVRPQGVGHTTRRVPEPAAEQRRRGRGQPVAALSLDWPAGSAEIAPYQTVEIGRPHPGSPAADFIALSGASRRINSCQLEIENTTRLVLRRPAAANPVQVGGRLIQPGERFEIEELPAAISLSGGEMMLTLSRDDP